MSGETGSLSDDLSHDRDAPGTRHPTDHLPPRHTRANITDEQHAEDHGELHHPTGHDPRKRLLTSTKTMRSSRTLRTAGLSLVVRQSSKS